MNRKSDDLRVFSTNNVEIEEDHIEKRVEIGRFRGIWSHEFSREKGSRDGFHVSRDSRETSRSVTQL